MLGAACNLVKAAVCGAVADGRDHLRGADFELAADRYFVAMGLHHRNPFRDGHSAMLASAA